MLDGELRGLVATIKDVSLRLDHHIHNSFSTTIGRTWPNVTLHIADSDVAAATNDFAENMTSPPALVFDGKVTWPDFNGMPLTHSTGDLGRHLRRLLCAVSRIANDRSGSTSRETSSR